MPTITGVAKLSNGSLYPSATFTFTRSPRAIVAQSSAVAVPQDVTVTSNASGAVSFALLPGTYVGTESATGIRFAFSVPEESTANFQDCVSAATIVPWPEAVQTVLDARDAALGAVNASLGFPNMTAFNTWATTASPIDGETVTVAGLPVAYLNPGPDFLDAPGWCPPGTVSMRYFGAEGDSTTTGNDVTTAFQDAAEYLAAAEYSGTQGRRALHIPGGQYRLTSGINWTEDFTSILGDGPRATLIHADQDSGPVFTFAASDPTTKAIVAPFLRGVGFRKFTASTGAIAVRVVRGLDAKFHSIQTQHLWGGFQIEGGQNINIFDHQHLYGANSGSWVDGTSVAVAGSFGWKFREGPVSSNKVPSNVMFSQVDIRSTAQTTPWLDCGIDIGAMDGLMGSAMHIGSCGGKGGMYFNPQVTTLSPYGSKCTWFTGHIDLDGGNKYGMYFKKIVSSDILEYADFASFPATGSFTKLYYAINTKTYYEWKTKNAVTTYYQTALDYGNIHLNGFHSRPAANHIYTEAGSQVATVNVNATMVNAGDNGVELLGGSGFRLRGILSGSGVNGTTGKKSAIALDNDFTHLDADLNFDKVESEGTTQLIGVEVKSASVDQIVVKGTAYDITTPVSDPYSYDVTADVGYKTYDIRSNKDTGFNIAVTSGAIQRQAYQRYIELDPSFTGPISGIVRRYPGALVDVKITNAGQYFVNGVGTTTISLTGGVDATCSVGDVFSFKYNGGPSTRGWQEISRAAAPSGFMVAGSATTLTIASGIITATSSYHLMDTEAAAATDDLDTINGGSEGTLLILSSVNSARDITVKNATGNIFCGSDRVLNTTGDKITLIKRGSQWHMTAFADN